MGELQKRINELLEHPHLDVIGEKAILKIVEEMMKDFPDLFKGVESKRLSNEEFTNLLVKQNRERLCWFMRWLKLTKCDVCGREKQTKRCSNFPFGRNTNVCKDCGLKYGYMEWVFHMTEENPPKFTKLKKLREVRLIVSIKYPSSHAFSKRYILKALDEEIEGRVRVREWLKERLYGRNGLLNLDSGNYKDSNIAFEILNKLLEALK